MEKWPEKLQQQTQDDDLKMEDWPEEVEELINDDRIKKFAAEMAKFRKIICGTPVLPKTMEIRFAAFGNPPYGPCPPEPGKLQQYFMFEFNRMTTATPTTTVGEIKEFILKQNALLKYKDLEIEYYGEFLSDDVTVKGICAKWPFLRVYVLHVQIFYRSKMFNKIYKDLIDMGITQENAKNHTNTVMQIIADIGVDVKMGGNAEILSKIKDSLQNKNKRMSVGTINNISTTVMHILQNNHVATNVVGANTEKAISNNIVDTFQKNHCDAIVSSSNEETKPARNNIVETFQKKASNTNVEKETNTKNNSDVFQDNGIDTSMVKESTIKQDMDTKERFHDNDDDSSMGKKDIKEEDTFQEKDNDTKEKTKKEGKDKDFSEKALKQIENLKDTIQRELVDRQQEISDMLAMCRARYCELLYLFPPPPPPGQE